MVYIHYLVLKMGLMSGIFLTASSCPLTWFLIPQTGSFAFDKLYFGRNVNLEQLSIYNERKRRKLCKNLAHGTKYLPRENLQAG